MLYHFITNYFQMLYKINEFKMNNRNILTQQINHNIREVHQQILRKHKNSKNKNLLLMDLMISNNKNNKNKKILQLKMYKNSKFINL